MLLDEYKDMLGVPGQGFHAARIPILNYALWDTIGTIVITWILVLLFAKDRSWQNTFRWILSAFIIGIFLHIIFGVRTTMTKQLVKFD